MGTTCGCEHEERGRMIGCQECGTACCRSCAVEVGSETYCVWCATSLAPARA